MGPSLAEKVGIFVLELLVILRKTVSMKEKLDRSSGEQDAARRIAMLIHAGCDIVDVTGPCDVLHYTDWVLSRFGKTSPAYDCEVLAANRGLVPTGCGIKVLADASISDAQGEFDTVIVAGGPCADQAAMDRATVDWLRSIGPNVRRLAAVCTGAFFLGAAGFLHNRRVTTHWLFSDQLAKKFPSVNVDASLIFSRDGNVYTSGGITAGIDLTLALVEEDWGHEVAQTVARLMVVSPRRPGGQSQFTAYLTPSQPSRSDFCKLQAWILGNPGEDLSVKALSNRMEMSARNFARLFQRELGQPPARFVERARADAARWKLEETTSPVETIAAECGFGNPERMRRTFQRLFDVSPLEYRARFRSP